MSLQIRIAIQETIKMGCQMAMECTNGGVEQYILVTLSRE